MLVLASEERLVSFWSLLRRVLVSAAAVAAKVEVAVLEKEERERNMIINRFIQPLQNTY